MAKKSREDWKIYKNVFDNFTNRTIFKLMSQGVIDDLKSPIKIGKESNVFSAPSKDHGMLIVKIYRLESCNFNKMHDYIREDMRYANIKKKRREIVFAWVQREYRNLLKAREAGVSVPTAYAVANNIVVMEFIGDSLPAPQLKDSIPEKPKDFLDKIVENYSRLYKKAGLVHGDLSQFNILNHNQSPIFIDFSQATLKSSSNSDELMKRDIDIITKFFAKYGHEAKSEELIKRIK